MLIDTLDYLLRDWTGRLVLTSFLLGVLAGTVVGGTLQYPLIGALVGVVVGLLGVIIVLIGLAEPVDGFGTFGLSTLAISWFYLVAALLVLGKFLLAAGVCIVPAILFWALIALSRKAGSRPLE